MVLTIHLINATNVFQKYISSYYLLLVPMDSNKHKLVITLLMQVYKMLYDIHGY